MTAAVYQRAMEPVVREHAGVQIRVAEGAIPDDLEGTLWRNGPGTNKSQGVPYLHPFDGDGHIVRFAFERGRVRYTNRFVRTRERTEEVAAGRPLYRSFGTNLPGGLRTNALRVRFKNAANTSVVHHGGKLLALWEGGVPHRLDPETLETLGRDDLDGALRCDGPLASRLLTPELPFSAHPKIDEETGELFNFGTLLGAAPRLLLHRGSARGRYGRPTSLPLDRLVFVHDFVLTPKYQIFFLVPVAFRMLRAISGLTPPAEAIESLTDQGTKILLVPRDGSPPVTLDAQPCFVFHFAYATDEDDGRVAVVGMRMPSFPSTRAIRDVLEGRGGAFPMAHPTQWLLDPRRGTVQETVLDDRPAELPTIAPGRPRAFWSIAGQREATDPFQQNVQRFDLARRDSVVRSFAPDLPGEPLFVPPGYVLTLVYRAAEHRSDLYVLDAERLSVVARIELPHHVPPGFHGTWLAGR